MTHLTRRAFTLIELLVVIAIIAILAAILFPVFAQAKLAAKKTVALSNAKQIATAHMIYMGDYDDNLIKAYYGFPADCASWPGNASSYYGWRHALAPYIKSNDMMSDNTNPFAAKQYWVSTWDSNNDGDVLDQYETLPTNFAANTNLIGFANGTCAGPWTPVGLTTLDTLEEVAGSILMLPSRAQWNELKMSFVSTVEAKPGWCINNNCPGGTNGPIHAVGKQASFIWADGHAKAKNPVATLDAGNANRDDWGSKYALNPVTGVAYTQADRIAYRDTAWGEYK